MRIVNLTQCRAWYSDIEIIEVEEREVFFAVRVKDGERYFYEVRKWDMELGRDALVWRYEMEEDAFYMQKAYIYDNRMIIVRLETKGQLGVTLLNKNTGAFIKSENIRIGDLVGDGVIVINERYFLVRGENRRRENLYYLCDMEEGLGYLVTMAKLLGGLPVGHGLIKKLPCFEYQEEKWIVFNECYMEDYEYEEIYDCIEAKNFEKGQIRETEGLYVIALEQLVESIKQGKDITPFREIKRRWCDGWVRYLGMGNGYIYYREKDFRTQIETIYAIDMMHLEEHMVCQINHGQLEGVLRYGASQIYEDIREADRRMVKGHYGLTEQLEIPMHKRLRFESYLENRYIITSWWWESEVNGVYEYKEFVGIQDGREDNMREQEQEMLVYEGQCYIKEDTVLIY